ncbi:MAG TPA: PaaI family thioesterase [Candidatus Thermoplasmatota archaeon]|nr:PaaI family thioesterase [Candidatus Thermoplasmatota archaeon]
MTGVQDIYAPNNRCFGCGPANPKGLRIRSEEAGDGSLVARFTPEPHHEAFENVMNGGIVGALLDCHGNWTAAMALMRDRKSDAPPPTVTAEFTIKMRRPTPMREVTLRARPVEIAGDRVVVEGTLGPGDEVTATLRGVFVAVKPGHPAYHRW